MKAKGLSKIKFVGARDPPPPPPPLRAGGGRGGDVMDKGMRSVANSPVADALPKRDRERGTDGQAAGREPKT